MREDVVTLLAALGIKEAGENPLLDLVIRQVQQRIRNLTNLPEIPEGLSGLAVRMAAGEVLSMMKNSGQLEGFEPEEGVVKQIVEGDTSVTFAYGEGAALSPEQRLEALVSALTKGHEGEILRYRRLLW